MAGVRHLAGLCKLKRWTEEDARVVLGEARKSPLSLGAFAERNGLVAERLYQWARRLERQDESAPPVPVFREVVVQGRDTRAEIELRCGRIVRVDMDADPSALRALLQAIETC